MNISPDEIVLFKIPANIFGRRFYIDINMTLVGTWGIMLFLWLFFRYITKNFNSSFKMTRLQNMVEVLVKFLREQVEMMMKRKADDFIPLIGSLFIFILVANWSSLLPIPFYVNNNLVDSYIAEQGESRMITIPSEYVIDDTIELKFILPGGGSESDSSSDVRKVVLQMTGITISEEQ